MTEADLNPVLDPVLGDLEPSAVRVRKVTLDQHERGKAKNRKPKPTA